MQKRWAILVIVIVAVGLTAGGIFAYNAWGNDSNDKKAEKPEEIEEPKEAEDVTYEIEGDEIILSWGEKPTGGYAINIEEVKIDNEVLMVSYSLRSPGEDEIVTQAITYPEDSAEIPGEFEEVQLKLLEHQKGPS